VLTRVALAGTATVSATATTAVTSRVTLRAAAGLSATATLALTSRVSLASAVPVAAAATADLVVQKNAVLTRWRRTVHQSPLLRM